MARYEKKGQMTYVDGNGNDYLLYPETLYEQVKGLSPALGDWCKSVSHWDDAKTNGFYSTANGSPTAAAEATVWAGVVIADPFTGQITQRVWSQGKSIVYEAVRQLFDNTWTSWAWVNPPLIAGTEYLTTRRYKGSPVYEKVDSNGNILWRTDNEPSWHLLASASAVVNATVE